MSIILLDKSVWGQIAAGEVVEKPASIVKELIENSIDAGAKNITIEIKDGGTSLISIIDDGCGIDKNEIKLAFTAHATSKLKKIDDLDCLTSMGFRGEALSSISAVSFVELCSKTNNEEIGTKVCLEGGQIISKNDIAMNKGTSISVSHLFYNTPARAKFLRKNKTEENDITNYVEKLMLANPEINFKYIIDEKLKYNTLNCSIIDIIYTIYGKEVAENLLELNYKNNDYLVSGYISKPTIAKSNRTYQSLFVNKRFCINQMISSSISSGYEDFLMKGKFPVYVLYLNLPQTSVDVNVHPSKLEVKFENSQKVYGIFNNAVFDTLSKQTHIRDIEDYSNEDSNISFNKVNEDIGVSFKPTEINNMTNESITKNEYKPSIFQNLKNNELEVVNLFEDKNEIVFNRNTDLTNVIDSKTINNEKINLIQEKQKKESSQYESMFSFERKIVGTAFSTYIIIEEGDNLYFIDQHAAHERQLFDKFMSQIENNTITTQNLLIPYILNLNDYESDFMCANLDLMNSFGFDIEEFGKNTYKVSQVPMLLADIDLKEYFLDVFANLDGIVKKPQEVLRNTIATKACKSAVKGGMSLSMNEINTLLDNLKKEKNILLCPHGRPVVLVFTKSQIEKMFKRIV